MSNNLARKYRPKRFADVAVQSHVATTLQGAIAHDRVAHGYLLCGPRGVGKTTLARVFAMALNCERRSERTDGEPCGLCHSCTSIWAGSANLDVVEMDAASNRGVDDARDLRERARYAPSGEHRYKVYIVDEAHMLTREAWNALLKILEEPPPRVVFVFATTEPEKIAQTAAPVLSRLQRFDLKRIGPADVRVRMQSILREEKLTAESEALALIAKAADGSMRDALSLTDQVLSLGERELTVARVREALGLVAEDEYVALFDLIAEQRAAEIFPAVGRLVDAGVDLGVFLSGFADLVRAQLATVLGGDVPELSETTRVALSERRARWTAGDLLRMLSAITEMEPRFRKSSQQQILIESLLVRFALMDRTVVIEEMLRGLGGDGGRSGRSGARDQGEGSPARTRVPAREPERAEPHPTSSPPRSPGARAALEPLSLNRLVERWDEIVAGLRTDGRNMLASVLDRGVPVAVSGRGDVTLELDGAQGNEQAVANGAGHLLAAIGAIMSGATRISVRPTPAAAPKRLTEESLRSERLATLRKRDAALDAAVDALDLELID
ncbi:MAG: DNA polymerase III subunit gamma/tau [Gemmatimonadota bacterium]|nr:DNA polymerase III subunit gamma/tau [Gemmatimonadota bacterium]